MTESASRKARWSKNGVRALAWITGGATFLASGAVLAGVPKPGSASAAKPRKAAHRKVIVRHVTHRVIVYDLPPSRSSGVSVISGSGGGTTTTSSSSGGSGGTSSSGGSGGTSSGGSGTTSTTTTSGS